MDVKKFFSKFFIFAFFTLFLISPLFSLDIPKLNAPVTDSANIISNDVESELNSYLQNLSSQTGIQIAVFTISSLSGENIEDAAFKIAEKWKLGQADKDNGILLLISSGDRQMRIEVGYGLEHLLTDAKCGLIIRNIMTPAFRNGDYSGGIKNAIMNIVGITTENVELISSEAFSNDSDPESVFIPIIFFVIFIFVVIIGSKSSKNGKNGGSGPVIMPSNHFGGMNRNSFSGGGSFGGFSGGGGSFGGGGASGRW
ncbi:MAG: TPM domain-containing protein [Spirochaetaceae bacterium]|nr:TPM domain-containing protein [Spirochaetaceae bacterium]